jgi:catechol 2,3-dioxygenase-like lactoylglutathione lyase family enzyme
LSVAALVSLDVGDPPALWRSLGFALGDDASCDVGGVVLRLGAPHGSGVVGWTLSGADGLSELPVSGLPASGIPVSGLPASGIPVSEETAPSAERSSHSDPSPPSDLSCCVGRREHPNGVIGLDHVVVTTPDLARTTAAFEACGVRLRRTRDIDTGGGPMRQAFFRLGPVVVEVVGPASSAGDGPAGFWGLAFTVEDLGVTAAVLADALGPVSDAVQPGRRIATLRRSAGSSVPVAFMTAAPDRS